MTPDPESIEERLRTVEGTEAVCADRWTSYFRWKEKADSRVSTLEKNQYRWAGAIAALSILGAMVGGALVKAVLGG